MTQTIAEISLTELSPILVIFAGMLVGFYGIAKFLMVQAEKDRMADRQERLEMAKAFNRVAVATEKSADEAQARNGHLAELTIGSRKAILEALESIKIKQNVSEQIVDHQVVEHEQVNNKEN